VQFDARVHRTAWWGAMIVSLAARLSFHFDVLFGFAPMPERTPCLHPFPSAGASSLVFGAARPV